MIDNLEELMELTMPDKIDLYCHNLHCQRYGHNQPRFYVEELETGAVLVEHESCSHCKDTMLDESPPDILDLMSSITDYVKTEALKHKRWTPQDVVLKLIEAFNLHELR